MALTDKQITVLNLLIYENKLKKEAAEAVGVVPGTVSEWFKIPEFIKTYEEMRNRLLQEASYRALQTMIDLATNAQSEAVRATAAKDILSRAGMDAITKQEITQKTITVGLDEEDDGNQHQHQAEEEFIQQDISAPTSELPDKV